MLQLINRYLSWVYPQAYFGSPPDVRYMTCQNFYHRGFLKVIRPRLLVRIIDDSSMQYLEVIDDTRRKREVFGMPLVSPFDVLVEAPWLDYAKTLWCNRNIKCSVIHPREIKPKALEYGNLQLYGSLGER